MSNSYEYVKNARARLKERAIYVMGDKCQCCGYNKCQTALEFHHLNPLEKEFTIGKEITAWDKVREELPKTILVCANCHREIHAGLLTNLTSSFNEERAKEIDDEMFDVKHHKIHYCKHCGAEITAKAEYCQECYHLLQRQVERPTREQLKQDIRNTSFVKVGKKYGVTDNAIRKWCKSMELPSKVSDIKNISDEEWALI